MKAYLCPILLFLALLPPLTGSATTFTSAAPGYWNNPQCWLNGQIPSLAGGETILIKHSIMFLQQLNLVANTAIIVDSTGGLCGHYQVIIPTGSSLHNYGSFYSDTVTLPGGHLYNYASGDMLVTVFGLVNNGGGWSNYGGALQVGASFTCGEKASGITENSKNPLRMYPQPAKNGNPLYIELPVLSAEAEIRLVSASGADYGTIRMENGVLYPDALPNGLYLLVITDAKQVYRTKLLIAD